MSQIIERSNDTFRIAVELNNIGVTLLEAEDYKGAMHTLSEAVEVMKLATCPDFEQTSIDINSVYSILAIARRRTAPIRHMPTSKASIYSQESSFIDFVKPDRRLPYPIIIAFESLPIEDEENDSWNPDMESSIIFYNLAVVHVWASRRIASKEKFLRGSLKLFQMCVSLTLVESNSLLEASLEDIRHLGSSRLLLGVMALNNVMELQKRFGNHDEARDCLKCLMRLGHVVRLDGIMALNLTGTTPAA